MFLQICVLVWLKTIHAPCTCTSTWKLLFVARAFQSRKDAIKVGEIMLWLSETGWNYVMVIWNWVKSGYGYLKLGEIFFYGYLKLGEIWLWFSETGKMRLWLSETGWNFFFDYLVGTGWILAMVIGNWVKLGHGYLKLGEINLWLFETGWNWAMVISNWVKLAKYVTNLVNVGYQKMARKTYLNCWILFLRVWATVCWLRLILHDLDTYCTTLSGK